MCIYVVKCQLLTFGHCVLCVGRKVILTLISVLAWWCCDSQRWDRMSRRLGVDQRLDSGCKQSRGWRWLNIVFVDCLILFSCNLSCGERYASSFYSSVPFTRWLNCPSLNWPESLCCVQCVFLTLPSFMGKLLDLMGRGRGWCSSVTGYVPHSGRVAMVLETSRYSSWYDSCSG